MTPGPWRAYAHTEKDNEVQIGAGEVDYDDGWDQICVGASFGGHDDMWPNAHWIAACSPDRILPLASERDAAVARCAELERFAAGWHNAVEAICTIAGASCGLGAGEAVEAVRTILDRDRTNLRHWRGEAGKLHARAEARLSEESPNVE